MLTSYAFVDSDASSDVPEVQQAGDEERVMEFDELRQEWPGFHEMVQKEFPEDWIIMPGANKFPRAKKWQNCRKTPKSKASWRNVGQMMLLCGEVSGVTVVDIDGDLDWWLAFCEKHEVPRTTTVRTPSGGLHMYFKYNKYCKTTTKLWGNRGGTGSIDIDIRNDRSCVCLPGSIYQIHPRDHEKKKHKLKFEGVRYDWARWDGEAIDFQEMQPMPMCIRDIRRFGVDKETMEICYPVPKFKKRFRDVTGGSSEISVEKLVELVKAIQAGGKYSDNHTNWMKVSYAACKICDMAGYPEKKFDVVNEFSMAGEGYDGDGPVRRLVNGYAVEFPIKNPLSYLLQVYLPKQHPLRDELLKDVKRQYYYLDYERFVGLCDLEEIKEYFTQAFRVIDRGGVPQFYIRDQDEHGNDKWVICDDHVPFGRKYTSCPFSYVRKTVVTNEDGEEEEKTEQVGTSLSSYLNRNWRVFLEPYKRLMLRQFVPRDGVAKMPPGVLNVFGGYPHKVLTDKQYEHAMESKLGESIELIHNHFLEVMANGDAEFNEYQLNWFSYVLRYGSEKVGTVLLYAGEEGTGKGMAIVDLMCNAIIGPRYTFICTDLKRFTGNFSAHRENKILCVFNECMDVKKTKGVEFDKVKAIITDKEFACERKNKAVFMSRDTAGYTMLSNWESCVALGNGDRRYAISAVSEGRKGDFDYFQKLGDAIADTRVQQLWYNLLIRRDIEKWERRRIPESRLKRELIEKKQSNAFPRYLKLVVTKEITAEWYRGNLAAKDSWFGLGAIKQHFREWFRQDTGKHAATQYKVDECLRRTGTGWVHKGEQYRKRVVDRSEASLVGGRQVICLKVTKDSIRELHRAFFRSPEWDYDS